MRVLFAVALLLAVSQLGSAHASPEAELPCTEQPAPATCVLAQNAIGATERANSSSLQLEYTASLYLTEPTRQPVALLLGTLAATDANLDFVLAYAARMLKLDQEKILEQLSAHLDALKQHEDELQDRLAHNGEGSTEVVQDIAVTAASISDDTARLLLVLRCLVQTAC